MHTKKKIALVTGASRGIGKEIALVLSRDDYQVICCGRNEVQENYPSQLIWMKADVSKANDVRDLHRFIQNSFGTVSLIVNNAGIQLEKTIVDTTEDDWGLLIDTNCKGVFNVCREFIPEMEKGEGGSIINIGSISGKKADPGMAIYVASKGFVHSLTRAIAVDHGPKIRCNSICPGWVRTEMTETAFETASNPAMAEQDAIQRHPSERLGTPRDIANFALWMASDQASFITGQCIDVDGGLNAVTTIRPDLF